MALTTEMCRTCLRRDTKKTSIFDPILMDDDGIPIAATDLLNIFPKIQIYKDDDFPKNVCSGCIKKLCQVYWFMMLCEKSQSKLKELIKATKKATAVDATSNGKHEKTKMPPLVDVPHIKEEPSDKDELDITIKEEIDVDLLSEDKSNAHIVATPDVLDHDNFIQASLLKTLLETNRPPPPPPKNNRFTFTAPGPMETSSDSSTDELVIIKQEPELDLYLDTDSSESGGEDLIEMNVCDSTNFYPNAPNPSPNNSSSNKYRCSTCSRKFSTKSAYEDHLDNCLPLLECDICLMAFSDGAALDAHMDEMHVDEEQFEIKKGDFQFQALPQKTSSSNFKCVVCTIDYGSERNLEMHMRTKHLNAYKFPGDDMSKSFTCEYCSKQFATESRLFGHLRIHRCNITCSICDKSFRSKHHLQAHQMRIHANKWKTIQCDVCYRFFACNADLIRHQLTHTKEKPYECNACSEKYRYKRFLENHMKSVHGTSDDDIKLYMNEKYDKTLERTLKDTFTCTFCQEEVSRLEIGAHLKTHD